MEAMMPQMSIIIENTLSAMALRSLLLDIVPGIEVVCYRSMEDYRAAMPVHTAHFFVSDAVAFHNPDFFKPILRRTIIITTGEAASFAMSGFNTIDATETEQHIVRQLLSIHHAGHPVGHPVAVNRGADSYSVAEQPQLSARERDVLALVVKGMINKEIADALNVSVATVIFHRNNISTKLGTRSIGRLTVYAVLNNIVALSEI